MVALAFAGGVWYFGSRSAPETDPGRKRFGSRMGSTAIPVRAVPAKREDLPVHLRAIGTVMPLNTVTIRSRVEGELLRVNFQEGQRVKQGDLLAEIDPVPYEIRLAQMEAELRQNEAQLQTVRNDLERFRQLHTQTLITQQQLEAQQALVAQREAAVAADQARVADARRQLAYTKIEAPIPGRVGLRRVDPGNLVRPADAAGLVVLTQTQPIAVTFTVPENDLHKVLDPLRAGGELTVEAWDRNENRLLATGILETVDNQIDPATGTLRLKAEFPNPEERLFPNQFVNVRLRIRTLKDAIVIPSAAVQFGSRGTYVYVVNAEQKAMVRDIELGPSEGERQAVIKGLQADELVVLEGVDRLREGRSVTLVGEEAPNAAPKAVPPAGGKKKKGGGSGGPQASASAPVSGNKGQ